MKFYIWTLEDFCNSDSYQPRCSKEKKKVTFYVLLEGKLTYPHPYYNLDINITLYTDEKRGRERDTEKETGIEISCPNRPGLFWVCSSMG